jgi:hypothetical protein
MNTAPKKIFVVVGHYGSGKTNFTANLAVKEAMDGEKVTVVDLDTVNPYFRSADFSELFDKNGIKLCTPMYANTNLDIPALSFDIGGIFKEGGCSIIDVGGDDAGAYALGRYEKEFETYGGKLQMLYVVNMYRLLTETPEEAVTFMREIEAASRLKCTAIVNNSNLGEETTAETIESSISYAEKISELTSLPLYCTVDGTKEGQADVPKAFKANIYVKKPWE